MLTTLIIIGVVILVIVFVIGLACCRVSSYWSRVEEQRYKEEK